MALKIWTDIDEVLRWIGSLPVNPVKGTPDIEGAPSPPGGRKGGRIPEGDWRPLRCDLSDLPRNERWCLRRTGDYKTEIRVMIPIEARPKALATLVDMSGEQLMMARVQILIEREALIEQKLSFLREQTEINLDAARAIGEAARAKREMHADSRDIVAERAKYIEDLADLRDELSEGRKENEWLRQASYVSAKAMDAITLWRLGKKRNADGSFVIPPEFRERIQEFLEFHRREMARPAVAPERKAKHAAIFERLFGLEDKEVDELLSVLKGERQDNGEAEEEEGD